MREAWVYADLEVSLVEQYNATLYTLLLDLTSRPGLAAGEKAPLHTAN